MESKKVVAYGYFSNFGINTKENAMQHFQNYISQNRNWELKEVYLYTGSKIRNTEMIEKIVKSIENKEIDIVVLLKLRHLGKEKDFYNFVDKALAKNVNVISLKDNFNTLDDNCRIQYLVIREMMKGRKGRNKKILDR